MAEKRIINLTETSAISESDYLVIDSAAEGTRKVSGAVINDAIGDVAEDISSLDAQFQQFIAPTGEAPNPTEIENARVGDDGVTYTNLGTAIRTQFSDVKSALSKMELVKSVNKLDAIDSGHFYSLYGAYSSSSSYKCSTNIIPVSEGDVVRFYARGDYALVRYITAYSGTSAVFAKGAENNDGVYTVPSGIDGIRVSWNANYADEEVTINYEAPAYEPYFPPHYIATDDFLGEYAIGQSENVLDTSTVTDGVFINLSGTQGSSASYAASDYIKVDEGDVVVMTANVSGDVIFRYVTAYNSHKKVMPASGAESVTSYTVPSEVAYIRVSADVRYMYHDSPTTRINLNGVRGKWQAYYSGTLEQLSQKGYTLSSDLYNYPLTSLPTYMLGAMARRPLGSLSKGYICLVSDDGGAGVATYTIPMLQTKGDVPCTFAVMADSEVFETQSGIDAVVDAVTNHNCEIAQHGGRNWVDHFDEYTLNKFFDSEESYWDSLGLTAYGAVCPEHKINDLIRAVAGGRFRCVRTGYQNADVYYGDYCNGARSNIFGLASQSSLDNTLDYHKAILDDCKNNHWLRMIHWHEAELDASSKAQLEGIIDYAQQIGLTFITMKDIPTII